MVVNESTLNISMIRVDGHDCWHELINNNPENNNDSVDMLRFRLQQTEGICTEISWLSLPEAENILAYTREFPNIKRAVFYKTNIDYLDPEYCLQEDLDFFCEYQSNSFDIYVEFQDLNPLNHKPIKQDHLELCLAKLNSLYWVEKDREFYMETNSNATMYKWYNMIKLNYPEYSLEQYHNMILNSLQ